MCHPMLQPELRVRPRVLTVFEVLHTAPRFSILFKVLQNDVSQHFAARASPVTGAGKQVSVSRALAAESAPSSTTTDVPPSSGSWASACLSLCEPLSLLCTATWHCRACTLTSGRWQMLNCKSEAHKNIFFFFNNLMSYFAFA